MATRPVTAPYVRVKPRSANVMRTLSRFIAICCAFAALPLLGAEAPAGPESGLIARLDTVLHSLDASGAVFSARLIELPSGRELYAPEPDRPVIPASNGTPPNPA